MNLETLSSVVLEILRVHPEGISEYDLISALDLQAEAGFKDEAFRDNLSLFRAHFLLFHVLFRLRESLWASKEGNLQVSALNIRLTPYQPGENALAEADPLREYYLDLANLEETTAEELAAWLDAFWRRLLGEKQRLEALEVLGLEEPVDKADIKQRYRELVMRHHPDRGGDKEAFQALHKALATLLGR